MIKQFFAIWFKPFRTKLKPTPAYCWDEYCKKNPGCSACRIYDV